MLPQPPKKRTSLYTDEERAKIQKMYNGMKEDSETIKKNNLVLPRQENVKELFNIKAK